MERNFIIIEKSIFFKNDKKLLHLYYQLLLMAYDEKPKSMGFGAIRTTNRILARATGYTRNTIIDGLSILKESNLIDFAFSTQENITITINKANVNRMREISDEKNDEKEYIPNIELCPYILIRKEDFGCNSKERELKNVFRFLQEKAFFGKNVNDKSFGVLITTQRTLAKELQYTLSTTQDMLKKLQQRGLITILTDCHKTTIKINEDYIKETRKAYLKIGGVKNENN